MKFRLLLSASLLINAGMLQANERWFEVEMIIFERTAANPSQEQFPEQVTPIRLSRHHDLISPLVNPPIQPLLQSLDNCQADTVASYRSSVFDMPWIPTDRIMCQQEIQPLAWQRNSLFPEYLLNGQGPWPSRITPRISGSGVHVNVPYLADSSAFALAEVADRIRRQRNHAILLHTVWRQAPVTERRAIPSRWFAGENFSQRFDYWGQPQSGTVPPLTQPIAPQAEYVDTTNTTIDVFQQIESRRAQLAAGVPLEQPSLTESNQQQSVNPTNLPTEVWQLDGLFKLHLDHYLFVNTDFNVRRLSGNTLQSINVKQSRRVISGEIHYLDHPKLGIVLQIRRFQPELAVAPPEQ